MLKANNGHKPRNIVITGVVLSTMVYLSAAQASNVLDSAEGQNDLLAQFNMQTDIATKTRLNVKHVPGVVDVMYGSTLRKRGYQTVLEALTRLPGFQTLNNGYKTNPNIRGNISDTFQGDIQILLNGVSQVSGNDLQPFMVLDMPLAAIDRIEVIKGPGSALYGEYALNGVVNIVTVSDAEGGSAHVGGGSFNTHSASASQRLEGDDWHASITAMTRRTDGPQHFVEGDLLTAIGMGFASSAPGKADTRNYFDSVVLQAKYKETQIDASFMSSLQGNQFGHFDWLSGNEEYQDELRSEALQITQGLGRHGGGELKVFAGIQRYHFDRRTQAVPKGFCHPKAQWDRDIFNPFSTPIPSRCLSVIDLDALTKADDPFDLIPAGTTVVEFPEDAYLDLESTVQRGHGRVQWISDFSDTHRILVEAAIQHIDVTKTRDTTNFDFVSLEANPGAPLPFYPQEQSSERNPANSWSLFGVEKESYSIVLQDEITVSDSTRVTAGVRWDDFEGGDDIYSPRLALAHQISDNKLVKLQWASAFRPPSLHQEVSSLNTADYEKMDTLDVQFSHNYERWMLNHVAYVSWVDKKIVPYFALDGIVIVKAEDQPDRPTYINSPEQHRYYGLENTIQFQATESMGFEANIAYGRGDGLKYQKSEFFISPITVDFNVTWDMTQSLQWFLEHRYWGPTKRRPRHSEAIYNETRSGLGSQFMTNLSLNISPLSDDRLTVIVAVENIFDEDVKAPSGWGLTTSFPNDLPQNSRRINAAVEYRW